MSDFDIKGARKAGYSDAEIADYLAGKSGFDAAGARKAGYSDAEILFHLATPSKSTAAKVGDAVNTGVNWLGTQITKGANTVAGLPADLQSLGNAGAKMALESVLGPGQATQPMTNTMPGAADLNQAVFQGAGVPEVNAGDQPALTLTDPFGIPGKVNVGKILDAGVQAIPSVVMGGAALPAAVGGMSAEGAGQATAGTPWEIPARLAAGFGGYKVGQRLQTPLPANLTPQQLQNVEVARELNIPMTVGQETGRLRRVESALSRFPTSAGRMADFADQQRQAINTAALGRTGTAGSRVDPNIIDDAFTRLGGQFDQLSQGQNVQLRPDFYNRTGRAVGQYTQDVLPSDVSPAVTRRMNDFWNMRPAQGRAYPELTSRQYQEIRSDISTAASRATDPGVRNVFREMRGALDDAMEASLPADRAQAWREAREHWANLKILSKASSAGTQESRSAGNLSPGALTSAVRQSRGVDQFARGRSPMDDISRVGDYLADTIPNSGTPQTLMMQGALTGGPIAGGYAAGGPVGAMIAGGAMAAPNVIARAMTGTGGASLLRRYLANQSQAANLGLLDARSVPFALFPAAPGLPRLESRQ